MANKILIVESPNKISKLKKMLGEDWDVKASVGHISDLAIKKGVDGLGIKDFENFEPIYDVSKDKKSVVSTLKKAIIGKEVFLAMDPDREGEAIANHLKMILKLSSYKRVTFSEISEKAVKHAIANPRQNDENLIKAQETRRIIDRIYGFKGSSVIRKHNTTLKSVGRVQSTGLKVVVEREREISNFSVRSYVEPVLVIKDNKYKLNQSREEIIEGDFSKNTWDEEAIIKSIVKSDRNVTPPKPLTTNGALKEGSKLGFKAAETTKLLQKLFEKGMITYIRTDSPNLSMDFKEEAKLFLEGLGLKYNIERKYKMPEGAQEGHEAIRPVHIEDKGDEISSAQEQKLYKKIRTITLCSVMVDGIDTVQKADVTLNGYLFQNKSKVVKEMGWRDVFGVNESDYSFSKIDEGKYSCDVTLVNKKTMPPARYSESSFLSKIEKEGIGRPSTYSTILDTIQKRKYVVLKDKQLIPTYEGFESIKFLEEFFERFIDLSYTKNMEQQLDEIANGKLENKKVLKEFWKTLKVYLKTSNESITRRMVQKYGTCPKCGSHLSERTGKYGKFYGCSNYPNCKFISNTPLVKKDVQKMDDSQIKDLISKGAKNG